MSTILKSKNVTIKKERQCFSCYRIFPIGTQMNYWCGICDGIFSTIYSCLTCVQIMNMDSESQFPEGYVHEMLNKGQTPEELLDALQPTTETNI